ncbi:MAG: CocE/NonD family hydrolase [Verrucomicrobia bacterium]|nr:CocE/NonD family hydrolase [Verrucomicrobiota bacterium]
MRSNRFLSGCEGLQNVVVSMRGIGLPPARGSAHRAGTCCACLAPAVVACLLTYASAAEAPPPDRAKQSFRVPMSDGVRLATDVFLPAGEGPFPAVIARTPYNKDGLGQLGGDGARRGYAMVFQDTRGRFASEGENLPFEADGWKPHRDGVETIAWLQRQPWCNGRIGTYGGSAVGITQLLLAGAGTDGVAAQHITVGAPSLYHDCVYPGGVFKKAMIEDWLRISRFSTNALLLWTRHPVHDAYWRDRELGDRYCEVNAPAVHIGGWFDIFAQGTLDAFVGYDREGGPRAHGRQKLVMGPWTHGVFSEKAGELQFPNAKKPPTTFHDPWRWFDHHLQGATNGVERDPAVVYYVMGDVEDPAAPGNTWRTADRWPPVVTRPTRWYLQPDRTLSRSAPAQPGTLTYSYDPSQPAPTVGGPQLTLPAGPKDQRPLENRPDVLVFSTETLTAPVEVTGRVYVHLEASSDAPDTDFFAKLCDVYPDGRSFNLCEGQLRARFRESFQEEKLLEPGRLERFKLDLGSTSVVFNRGHRIRLLVTSSSVPGYDPNPNTGEPFRASARTRVAQNTLSLGTARTSYLLLPVAGE